jgi:hypothetical protein
LSAADAADNMPVTLSNAANKTAEKVAQDERERTLSKFEASKYNC